MQYARLSAARGRQLGLVQHLEARGLAIEKHHPGRARGQARPDGAERQHYGGARVAEHVSKALLGPVHVERQIGATRLQHGEQRDAELEGPRQGDGHQRVGADAQRAQGARQAVGAPLERGVAEALVSAHERRRVGRALDLRLEQLVDERRTPAALGRRGQSLAARPPAPRYRATATAAARRRVLDQGAQRGLEVAQQRAPRLGVDVAHIVIELQHDLGPGATSRVSG